MPADSEVTQLYSLIFLHREVLYSWTEWKAAFQWGLYHCGQWRFILLRRERERCLSFYEAGKHMNSGFPEGYVLHPDLQISTNVSISNTFLMIKKPLIILFSLFLAPHFKT